MKRSRGKYGRILTLIRARMGRLFHPKGALPCVGLVVLGGCLTLIMIPDDPLPGDSATPAPVTTHSSPAAPRLEVAVLPTVVIDPGHGGKDDGTKWRGISEKDMTLDLGLRTERLLKTAGFPTVMTRRENVFISLEERARIANQLKDALFVSIHFNSDPTGVSTGIETFYARQKAPPDSEWTWVGFFNHTQPVETDTSEVFAGAVQSALDTRTQTRNRGIHSCNFYVVHHTRCPAVLVEAGFLSNAFETQLLLNEQYREVLAQGIVEGVMSYQRMRMQPGGVKPLRVARLDTPPPMVMTP